MVGLEALEGSEVITEDLAGLEGPAALEDMGATEEGLVGQADRDTTEAALGEKSWA